MANIAAMHMRLEGVLSDDVLVYTFGQPRTGNGDFAEYAFRYLSLPCVCNNCFPSLVTYKRYK